MNAKVSGYSYQTQKTRCACGYVYLHTPSMVGRIVACPKCNASLKLKAVKP